MASTRGYLPWPLVVGVAILVLSFSARSGPWPSFGNREDPFQCATAFTSGGCGGGAECSESTLFEVFRECPLRSSVVETLEGRTVILAGDSVTKQIKQGLIKIMVGNLHFVIAPRRQERVGPLKLACDILESPSPSKGSVRVCYLKTAWTRSEDGAVVRVKRDPDDRVDQRSRGKPTMKRSTHEFGNMYMSGISTFR